MGSLRYTALSSRFLHTADMIIGRMDKKYYYVQRTDRLLEPAMQNVLKPFSDPMMPHMELSQFKLTKPDKEWLKGEGPNFYSF